MLAKVSRPIVVGHLDTPIDGSIVRVAERAGTDRRGRLVVAPEGAADSHGTTTAAEIARVAPHAQLRSIAVLPGGDVVVRVTCGLRWLLDRAVDIVCLPLGLPAHNVILDVLIDDLVAAGSLVVAAIGNDGAGQARQPALHPGVLAVGACDPDGTIRRESGSLFRPAEGVAKPELVSASAHGSSLACAAVAGIAARLWSTRPDATADHVVAALRSTAKPPKSDQVHRVRWGVVEQAHAGDRLRTLDLDAPATSWQLPADRGKQWIDPRLMQRLDRSGGLGRVRAVLAHRDVTVVDATPEELRQHLADPTLRAASAPDIALIELTSDRDPAVRDDSKSVVSPPRLSPRAEGARPGR